MTKNPFTEPEDLTPLLEQSQKYTTSREKSLQNFLQSRNLAPTFYSPISIFMNTFHKYTLASFVVGMLIFSTVGTFAVENFAPSEFKPSKLFSNNKQKDKDPYTALAPDNDNYVANLESCDLALKFPKKTGDFTTNFNKTQVNSGGNYTISVNTGDGNSDTVFDIACDSENIYSYPDMQVKSLSISELNNLTGWFITQTELKNITFSEVNIKNDSNTQQEITFEYKGKFFRIIKMVLGSDFFKYNNLAIPKKAVTLEFNELQLQFTPLVKNTFSAEFASNDSISSAKNSLSSSKKSLMENFKIEYSQGLNKIENFSEIGSEIKIANYKLNSEGRNFPTQANQAEVTIQSSKEKPDFDTDTIKYLKDQYKSQISALEKEIEEYKQMPATKKSEQYITPDFENGLTVTKTHLEKEIVRLGKYSKEDGIPKKINLSEVAYFSDSLSKELDSDYVYLLKTDGYLEGNEIPTDYLVFRDKSGNYYTVRTIRPEIVKNSFGVKIGLK
jgi:hypothetical protein